MEELKLTEKGKGAMNGGKEWIEMRVEVGKRVEENKVGQRSGRESGSKEWGKKWVKGMGEKVGQRSGKKSGSKEWERKWVKGERRGAKGWKGG